MIQAEVRVQMIFSLQDLKKWLDNNPLIADKLGYTKKK